MSAARDVQLSMVDGMERPVGPILPSVYHRSNAHLMAAVAPLYLTGSVLDVTYGEGKWWDRYTPEPFTAHDLYKLDGVGFRALPEADGSVDTVCFDPPYVMSGGASATHSEFQGAYGIGNDNGMTGGWKSFSALLNDGLTECCRVGRRFVLVKCMEFAEGKRLMDPPTMLTNTANDLGWRLHDRIVHYCGFGPGGHNIFDVKRARRAHSYLLVFAQ